MVVRGPRQMHFPGRTLRDNGAQAASASVKIQTIGLYPSVRSEIMMTVVRAYEGADIIGDRLSHGIQLSLVPRA